MKNIIYSAAFIAIICALSSQNAIAQDEFATTDTQSESAYLSLGAGYFGLFEDDSSGDFRVEYADSDPLFWNLKPWGGVEATSEGSLWGGGGLKANFMAAPNIYIDPSVGVGLYSDSGDDIDLGSALEFRLQIEGGYEFTNGHRVGLALGHLSNAGIGDTNPGTETLNVYYHVPVGDLF